MSAITEKQIVMIILRAYTNGGIWGVPFKPIVDEVGSKHALQTLGSLAFGKKCPEDGYIVVHRGRVYPTFVFNSPNIIIVPGAPMQLKRDLSYSAAEEQDLVRKAVTTAQLEQKQGATFDDVAYEMGSRHATQTVMAMAAYNELSLYEGKAFMPHFLEQKVFRPQEVPA